MSGSTTVLDVNEDISSAGARHFFFLLSLSFLAALALVIISLMLLVGGPPYLMGALPVSLLSLSLLASTSVTSLTVLVDPTTSESQKVRLT
jgi:hypothetical protein